MTVAFRDEYVLSRVHEIEDRFISMQRMLQYLRSSACRNPKSIPLKRALIKRIENRQSALIDTLDALVEWAVKDVDRFEGVEMRPKQMRIKAD